MDNNCYVSKISLLLSSNFPLERIHPILSSVELLFTLLALTASILDGDVFNKSWSQTSSIFQTCVTFTRSYKLSICRCSSGESAVCFCCLSDLWSSSEALIKPSFDCVVYFDKKKMPSPWMMPLISCASDLGCSSRQGRWLQYFFYFLSL